MIVTLASLGALMLFAIGLTFGADGLLWLGIGFAGLACLAALLDVFCAFPAFRRALRRGRP